LIPRSVFLEGMKTAKILVVGACGQVGSELTLALRKQYGGAQVVAADIKPEPDLMRGSGPWRTLDPSYRKEL
jgi:nucleoside-diphosphate-sugar epimerase